MPDNLTKTLSKFEELLIEGLPSSALVMLPDLEKHIDTLKAELKQKDEKLSELQNGLPIEKAKEGKFYRVLGNSEVGPHGAMDGPLWFIARHEKGRWSAFPGHQLVEPKSVYLLPSTDKQEGEE